MSTGSIYEKTAMKMLDAAQASQPLLPSLKEHCPWIEWQIHQVSAVPGLLELWGKSLNFDEYAKTQILESPILRLIGELSGVPLRGRIVHAGLMHTYGYLFSTINTPFGKKRDRWVEPDLDHGFRWKTPTLRDRPSAGTLLTNLTYFLGRIAFRNQPEIAKLEQYGESISPLVRKYPFETLAIQRVIERVAIPNGRRRGTEVEIRTDFVAFPQPPKDMAGATHLLIYSLVNGPRLGSQLITAFCVTTDFVTTATSPENFGEAVEVRARFNSYIEGITGNTVPGIRCGEH